jgi:alpha-galactosidase
MLGLGYDVRRDDMDFALMRKFVAEWREVAPNYYGDFYPLTSWTYAMDTWMAWQFDRPEEEQGVVQAFRRPESNCTAAQFKLRGLDPKATYVLKNHDMAGTIEASGRDLLDPGLSVIINDRPGAVVITYMKKAL